MALLDKSFMTHDPSMETSIQILDAVDTNDSNINYQFSSSAKYNQQDWKNENISDKNYILDRESTVNPRSTFSEWYTSPKNETTETKSNLNEDLSHQHQSTHILKSANLTSSTPSTISVPTITNSGMLLDIKADLNYYIQQTNCLNQRLTLLEQNDIARSQEIERSLTEIVNNKCASISSELRKDISNDIFQNVSKGNDGNKNIHWPQNTVFLDRILDVKINNIQKDLKVQLKDELKDEKLLTSIQNQSLNYTTKQNHLIEQLLLRVDQVEQDMEDQRQSWDEIQIRKKSSQKELYLINKNNKIDPYENEPSMISGQPMSNSLNEPSLLPKTNLDNSTMYIQDQFHHRFSIIPEQKNNDYPQRPRSDTIQDSTLQKENQLEEQLYQMKVRLNEIEKFMLNQKKEQNEMDHKSSISESTAKHEKIYSKTNSESSLSSSNSNFERYSNSSIKAMTSLVKEDLKSDFEGLKQQIETKVDNPVLEELIVHLATKQEIKHLDKKLDSNYVKKRVNNVIKDTVQTYLETHLHHLLALNNENKIENISNSTLKLTDKSKSEIEHLIKKQCQSLNDGTIEDLQRLIRRRVEIEVKGQYELLLEHLGNKADGLNTNTKSSQNPVDKTFFNSKMDGMTPQKQIVEELIRERMKIWKEDIAAHVEERSSEKIEKILAQSFNPELPTSSNNLIIQNLKKILHDLIPPQYNEPSANKENSPFSLSKRFCSVEEIDLLAQKIAHDFDEKIFTLASDLTTVKAAIVQQTGLGTINGSEQFGFGSGMAYGQWIWKSGKLKLGSSVPWNVEIVNSNPDNLRWQRDTSFIKIQQGGLYEITFSFFTASKPSVQILVNGESVLSAINSPSYIVRHGSGLVLTGSAWRNGCLPISSKNQVHSANNTDVLTSDTKGSLSGSKEINGSESLPRNSIHRYLQQSSDDFGEQFNWEHTKHSILTPGTVTGLSLIDFLALPGKSTVSLQYTGKIGGEAFLGLRKLN